MHISSQDMEYFQTLEGSHETVPVTYTSRTTGKICIFNEYSIHVNCLLIGKIKLKS